MDSNTSRALALTLMLVGAAGLVGCGSSSNGGTVDAGGALPDASPGVDASTPDASPDDAGLDAAPPVDCGSGAPTGTQVVASTSPLVLQGAGVTSDGYAFYEDTNSQTLYAVSTAGTGAPASLGTVTSQEGTFYRNGGKAVLFLPAAANPTTDVAPLSAWSAATGPKVITTSAFALDSYDYTYDVTQDGSYVAYFRSAGGATVTLIVSTIDGATQTPLVSDIDLTNQNCSPMVQWVGNTLVAYYCLAAATPDGGIAGDLNIAAFAQSTSFGQVVLATFPQPSGALGLTSPSTPSADGTELLVQYTGLALYPIAGGTPTTVDADGASGGFTPTGDIIYATTSGALKLYSGANADAGADAGASVTLVASGAPGLLSLSPDGNWALVANNEDQSSGLTNLLLASAVTPGTPASLWQPTTADAIGFTADSKFEMFATNFPADFGISHFDLQASPVSGGAPTKIITSAGGFALTTGSKVVVNANPNALTGSADLLSVDLATPASPSTLVTQADPNYFYLSSANKVVYSWHCEENATSGIWAVSAP